MWRRLLCGPLSTFRSNPLLPSSQHKNKTVSNMKTVYSSETAETNYRLHDVTTQVKIYKLVTLWTEAGWNTYSWAISPWTWSCWFDIVPVNWKGINRQVLIKFRHNRLKQVKYCVLRSTNSLILFGIGKNYVSSGRSLLLHQFTRTAIHHCYQLHNFIQYPSLQDMSIRRRNCWGSSVLVSTYNIYYW
jgi:hypothetical protein